MQSFFTSLPWWFWAVSMIVLLLIGVAAVWFVIVKKRNQPDTSSTETAQQQDTPTYEYTKDGVVSHENDAEEDAKRRLRLRRRNAQLLAVMLFFSACAAFLAFGAYRYASLSLTPTAQIRDGANAFFDIGAKDRTYYTTLNKWFTHIGWIDEQQFSDAGKRIIATGYDTYLDDVTTYIQGKKFFGFKRVELAPLARTLVQSYNTVYAESLESLKALNQYRYVTPEVTSIVQDGADIQQPLVTIESIKLTT